MNKNSDPVHNFSLEGGWEYTVPQLKFFQTSGIVRNESSYRELYSGCSAETRPTAADTT